MSAQANREILNRFLGALAEDNLDTLLQDLAEDAIWHQLDMEGMAVMLQGHDQISQGLTQFMSAFEPGEITREIFINGDRAVVIRQGSPRSKFTGETLDVCVAHALRFSNNKITEVRAFYSPELVTLMRM